jgi:hypothetical protein
MDEKIPNVWNLGEGDAERRFQTFGISGLLKF